MTDVDRTGLVPLHGLTFDVAAASEQGPRSENQDAYSIASFAGNGVVVVADGMGGERAGRVAADTAVQAVLAAAPFRSLDAARFAVRAADEAVARSARAAPQDREGMGCALALMALTPDRAGGLGWIGAHVGDVRIISRGPDGTVRLETRDHTQAFARWEAGEVALDEIPDTQGANRLTRAVGRGGEADATWIPVRPGWSYLLVSDGITKAMRLDELGEALGATDPAGACAAIRRKVEERGPDDNYTVVAVRVGLDDGATVERPHPPSGAATLESPGPRPPARRPTFDPPSHVTDQRRSSAWGPIAALLALLALGVAGYTFWTARQAGRAASADELQRMRTQVDSLRLRLDALAPDSVTASLPPLADTAAPALSRPAAPRTAEPRTSPTRPAGADTAKGARP